MRSAWSQGTDTRVQKPAPRTIKLDCSTKQPTCSVVQSTSLLNSVLNFYGLAPRFELGRRAAVSLHKHMTLSQPAL